MPKMKKPKHNNIKTQIDGITFDSKAEASRYLILKSHQQQGLISGLERQKRFEIAPPCHLQGRKRPARYYVADFVYLDASGTSVVEDVKGKAYGGKGRTTEVYRLKRHLMKTLHNIEILET